VKEEEWRRGEDGRRLGDVDGDVLGDESRPSDGVPDAGPVAGPPVAAPGPAKEEKAKLRRPVGGDGSGVEGLLVLRLWRREKGRPGEEG